MQIDDISKLDKVKEKKAKKVSEAQAQVSEGEQRLARQREQLADQDGREPATIKAELTARMNEASDAARHANDASREHRGGYSELERASKQAASARSEIDDAKKRKMMLVADKNRAAASAAGWVEQMAPEHVKEAVVGPLIMHIDVPDPSHQPLVEAAIGAKYATSAFLAKNDEARNTLSRQIAEQKWGVNVYKNSEGAFRPRKRPSSESMAKFGVTKWLDEALLIPPEHRDVILCALRDLASVDAFLLATPKTMNCFEALQNFLKEQGVEQVTVLTPERTYRVQKSKYGERRMNATTQAPRRPMGLYNNSTDDTRRAKLEKEAAAAEKALRAHQEEQRRLDGALQSASDEKDAARNALSNFSQGATNLKTLEARLEAFKGRLSAAQKEEAEYDVSAQRGKLEAQLATATKREVAIYDSIAEATAKMIELRGQECAAQLAHAAAKHRLAEASEAVVELKAALDEKKREKDEAEKKLKEAQQEHQRMMAEARKVAPHLGIGANGGRSARAQADWDAMPNDLEQLEAEIEDLQEEIESSYDDNGQTLRDYEQRLADIEAGKGKVEATGQEVESLQSELDKLTAEWKPELDRMVGEVNNNFSAYFRTFNCCGEVALADGRKLNPLTGQPEGADDFSQYKIHIKVQWRPDEELHVLGEGGRDSGGERSVATMVYLISLQNINPAPFRVVDEINQAMDSTNERNVFECITRACQNGGKQYFLLTPKLLPDLDYGEETAIQLVLNGPYNVSRSAFSLNDWV